MKILRQLAIVLSICLAGELLNRFLKIPIPGSVIGMIILLLGLLTGTLQLSSIEEVSEFLLKHLAFFFVPSGVGIISNLRVVKESFVPLLIIILVSTVVVIAVTGISVQLLMGAKVKELYRDIQGGKQHERVS
jgi:holin-like protein